MSSDPESPTVVPFGEDVLERMVFAVEKVRERLRRAAAALDEAKIPYAVIGGKVVAAWVSKVDAGAARNTVNRSDFAGVKTALASAGIVRRHLLGINMSLDGADGGPRDAVHVLFAGEKVRKEYFAAAPDLHVDPRHEAFRLLDREPLVRMKLTSSRDKDRTHLRDLIEVGLVDRTWLDRMPKALAERLQELLDNPDG